MVAQGDHDLVMGSLLDCIRIYVKVDVLHFLNAAQAGLVTW
jgi:hypothetical protein